MNDRAEGNKTTTTCAHSHKPAWWTDSLETSWGKVKAEVIQGWEKIVQGDKKLAQRVDAEAMAFGYGAHHAYRDFQVWGDKLEAMLRADWKETGHDAECAWTRVSAAVKHGWERAAGTTQPAAATKPASADVH
jgi:hypothetical protein